METLVADDGRMEAVVVRRMAGEIREMRILPPDGCMLALEVRRETVVVLGVLSTAAVAVVTVWRCRGQWSLYLGPSC